MDFCIRIRNIYYSRRRCNSSGRFFGAIAAITAGPSPMKWLRISILLCQSLQIALMTRKIDRFALAHRSGRIAFVHRIDNWNWPTNFKFIFLLDAIPINWTIHFYFIFSSEIRDSHTKFSFLIKTQYKITIMHTHTRTARWRFLCCFFFYSFFARFIQALIRHASSTERRLFCVFLFDTFLFRCHSFFLIFCAFAILLWICFLFHFVSSVVLCRPISSFIVPFLKNAEIYWIRVSESLCSKCSWISSGWLLLFCFDFSTHSFGALASDDCWRCWWFCWTLAYTLAKF